MRRPRIEHASTLNFNDLHVDLETHVAERAGKRLDLSKLDYDLRVALLRRPKRVFTREELLDDVWGADSQAGVGAVERYISYLREKVDDGFPQRLIHTVRGVGYTLRAD